MPSARARTTKISRTKVGSTPPSIWLLRLRVSLAFMCPPPRRSVDLDRAHAGLNVDLHPVGSPVETRGHKAVPVAREPGRVHLDVRQPPASPNAPRHSCRNVHGHGGRTRFQGDLHVHGP